MTLQELQQRAAQLAAEMRSHHESIGDTDWTSEQRSKWEAMKAEHKKITEKIQVEQDMRALDQDDLDAETDRKPKNQEGTQAEQRSKAFESLMRGGAGNLTAEQRSIIQEMRAQAAGTPAAGGYTVPTTFLARIVESLVAYGGIASVAQMLQTDSGEAIEWAVADGADEEGELLGENTETGEGDVEFLPGVLGSHTISSKVIRVSEQLLADSGVDLEGFLARRIASRCGRTRARLIVKGTGAGTPLQPSGLEKSTQIGKVAASAVDFTWQELNQLIHSVDPAYRMSPKFRLAFNDKTLGLIEEMEDTQGRPLWLPGIDAARPSTILGKQYVVDSAIADIGAGAKFAYAGDFDQLVVRMVKQMVLKRLVERYAEFGQVGFLGFMRFGVCLQDVAAIKALQGKPA